MNAPIPRPVPAVPATTDGRCGACGTNRFCLPTELDPLAGLRFDALISQRRRVARGTFLYRTGQPLRNLHAVRCGYFKTVRPGPAGEQVTGFQMAGELLGLEAIGSGCHRCDAVALEDGVVCDVPFAALEQLFDEVPGLQRRMFRLMSSEMNREQDLMLLLGNMRAEQRLAVFLVDIGERYAARGYSATQFQLRMSREDIGSYLGLTIESISRLLARFAKLGLITVAKRAVVLRDPARLSAMANGAAPCSPLA
jgi:CRP/FNR family transcriptional regulator